MSMRPERDIVNAELAKLNRVAARVLNIKLGFSDDCGREGIDAELKFLRDNGFNVPAMVRIVIQNNQNNN